MCQTAPSTCLPVCENVRKSYREGKYYLHVDGIYSTDAAEVFCREKIPFRSQAMEIPNNEYGGVRYYSRDHAEFGCTSCDMLVCEELQVEPGAACCSVYTSCQ